MGEDVAVQPDTIHDVAVVGLGPVGATLVNLLAADGLRVVALDREAEPYALPRAVHFDDEVMRLFQTIGLAEEILPHTHVSPGMHFIDANGRLFLDWSRPMTVGPNGWNISYRFHQPELERVLRAGAAARPTADIRLRADVFAVDEHDDHVVLRYEDLATGALRQVGARYVVGCDGARSLVRRLIGAGMEDLGFHERWLVVDVLLNRPRSDLGDYSVQFCDASRPATYVRGVGNRRRWEISIMPGDDPRRVTDPDNVWKLLSRWITPLDGELERAAAYTFHSVIALQWRRDRLLVAGDSAHQTPPFLGQGMCAGIRDAANLAWKLARVIRGQAPDALLDTYESERRPHVAEYIRLAVQLGGLINTSALSSGDTSDATGQPRRMQTIRPKLGPGLHRAGCSLAGSMAPQPVLHDGRRLDDAVGHRFAALMRTDWQKSLDHALLARCVERDVAVVADEAGPLAEWLDQAGAPAALVRPDRYVLGLARTANDMAALIDMI